MKYWCRGLKLFIHKQLHRKAVKELFHNPQEQRRGCLSSTVTYLTAQGLPAKSTLMLPALSTITAGRSQLSAPTCATINTHWSHTKAQPGLEPCALSMGSTRQATHKSHPLTTFQIHQGSTTARLGAGQGGYTRLIRCLPNPEQHHTHWGLLKTHRSPSARGHTGKTPQGKHSTEDQFKLQNADHRPGQVWNQKMLYWKGTKKPVTAAKFTAINYVVAVKRK